jgi:hypothetical protein
LTRRRAVRAGEYQETETNGRHRRLKTRLAPPPSVGSFVLPPNV